MIAGSDTSEANCRHAVKFKYASLVPKPLASQLLLLTVRKISKARIIYIVSDVDGREWVSTVAVMTSREGNAYLHGQLFILYDRRSTKATCLCVS